MNNIADKNIKSNNSEVMRNKEIELKPCPWCQNDKGRTDLDFSIIDDEFGAYVPIHSIKYCPFCGRNIKEKDNEQREAD